MKTPFKLEALNRSVIAVPPLCRDTQGRPHAGENARLIRYLESGGVTTLLYGGNANFYNLAPSEFESTLDLLAAGAAPETLIIPSVGPYFGTAMDQAGVLARHRFPTAMMLPTVAVSSPEGVRIAITEFVQKAGIPAVLYIKDQNYVTVDVVRKLVGAGVISWIKYAVVRPDTTQDPLLRSLLDQVDPALFVSGIGEQPAIIHWRQFGIRAFTSGCVCVAPRRSQEMLQALRAGDFDRAEAIRSRFTPLEALRNAHGPIPVLHHAVAGAGIAQTGRILPLLTELNPELDASVRAVACVIRQWNDATA